MVRLKDIAEACGVSVATVSRAVNGVTGENRERTARICEVARQMGYYPNAAAQTLKTSRSHTIGLLYENRMDHEYFSTLINDLRQEADAWGYDLTLICRGGGEDRGNYYAHARRRNLDGVIVIQADFDSAEVIRLATSALPSVILDHMYEGCNCVSSDNRAGTEGLVRHAYHLGHRRIALISGEDGAVSRERLAGYYKVCAELGLRVPEGFVRAGHYHDPESCAAAVRAFLEQPEGPTCVLCPDDYGALGALWALREEGLRIPERISLTGYDDIRMNRRIRPRLTTWRQDTGAIAREAVRLLLETIEEPERHRPRQITVAGALSEGDTVCELSR